MANLTPDAYLFIMFWLAAALFCFCGWLIEKAYMRWLIWRNLKPIKRGASKL